MKINNNNERQNTIFALDLASREDSKTAGIEAHKKSRKYGIILNQADSWIQAEQIDKTIGE